MSIEETSTEWALNMATSAAVSQNCSPVRDVERQPLVAPAAMDEKTCRGLRAGLIAGLVLGAAAAVATMSWGKLASPVGLWAIAQPNRLRGAEGEIAQTDVQSALPSGPLAAAVTEMPLFPIERMPGELWAPHWRRMAELVLSHSADGVFLYTVVAIEREDYVAWVVNWQRSIARGLPQQLAARRLLLGMRAEDCANISAAGVDDCVVDEWSRKWWLGAVAAGGPRELNQMTVLAKYAWTQVALSLGLRVLYNDVDIMYTGAGNPLQYMLQDRLTPDGRLPELQMISDHIGYTCDDAASVALARSTPARAWLNGTMDLSSPLCPLQPRYYPNGSTCVSTGFWLALPTPAVLRLFTIVANSLTLMPYDAWEQAIFNVILPPMLPSVESAGKARESGTLTAIALDPRVAGNPNAMECTATLLGRTDRASGEAIEQLVVHTGYLHGDGKKQKAKDLGLWLAD